MISIGKMIITAMILKKSCTVDAANARLNSVPLFMCPIDTIVFVTVVPIFAPIIMGTAPVNVRVPPPTIATINDVVVDELWNKVVANIPINKATSGLLVVDITSFAKPPPNNFMPLDNPFIPTRNKYNAKITPVILNIVFKVSFINQI